MPWGSIISGLVQAGIDIYGAATQGDPAGQYGNQLKYLANKYIAPYTKPSFWQIDPTALAWQGLETGISAAPAINQQNMAQLQDLLGTALPGYRGMVTGMQGAAANLMGGPITQQLLGPTTQAMIAGNVPSDVAEMIQRGGAWQALQTGMGAGGAATGTAAAGISSRALGLTSLDMMTKGLQRATAGAQMENLGFGQSQNLISMARTYLMPKPADPTSILPLSTLMQAQEWSTANQANMALAYYTARANSAAATYGQGGSQQASQLAGFGAGAGALTGSLFGGSGGGGGLFGQLGLGGGGGGGGAGGGMLNAESYLMGTSNYVPSTADFINYLY